MLRGLDIKGWKYKGNKLNNPIVIVWRSAWWVPLQILLILTCLCALIGFGKMAAKEIWMEVNR